MRNACKMEIHRKTIILRTDFLIASVSPHSCLSPFISDWIQKIHENHRHTSFVCENNVCKCAYSMFVCALCTTCAVKQIRTSFQTSFHQNTGVILLFVDFFSTSSFNMVMLCAWCMLRPSFNFIFHQIQRLDRETHLTGYKPFLSYFVVVDIISL